LEQDGLLLIDWRDLFCFLSENIMADIPEKAFEFHFTFADALIRMAEYARNSAGENKIVLSGGVFVNKLLNNLLRPRLQSMGFEVFAHSFTPPNDACIAVGQVIAASVGK
jgi:hydrogenase maturation protein HypF